MKSLVAIGAGILGLVVLAVAVVVIEGSRPATAYAPDSPEGVFQRHLAAFEAGDLDAAYALFSDRVRATLSRNQYAEYAGFPNRPPQVSRRVLLDGRSDQGETVTLHLTVEEIYANELGASRSRRPLEVRMVRQAGAWRVDQPFVGLDMPALPLKG